MSEEILSPSEDNHSEDIRAELQRILASSQFEASDRNRRFLGYVIEETLAGRAGRIKAYNIATEVFGRDVNFDPQLDPVVRMEARRLRRSLDRFYLTEGKGSPIRIAMPKGGYAPEFQNTITLDLLSETATRSSIGVASYVRGRGPAIVVTRFDSQGDESIFPRFSHGFADQILVGLSRYPEFSVFDATQISGYRETTGVKSVSGASIVDFVLTGSTALFQGSLSVKAVLVEARTGRVLWGQSFEQALGSGRLLQLRDDIADTIVRALAEPFGVIFRRNAEVAAAKTSGPLTSTDNFIRFYQYRRSYRRNLFHQLRLSLESEVTTCPEDSEALACLSLLYTDAQRFGFTNNESPGALRKQAAALARRAVDIDPNSARGHHAQGMAHWFLRDVPAGVREMQTSAALNPNASDAMADLGLMWSLLGDWKQALPYLEKARGRNPPQSSACHTGLSLYHFANGRFEDALADALEIDAPDVAHGFVTRAIAQIRLGCKLEAAKSVERIVRLDLRPRGGLAEFGGRNVKPELAGSISEALREAGLPPEFIGD